MYRLAERKALTIGRVSRVLKQCAVDCLLNHEQMGFTVEQMQQTITQNLSSGKSIEYQVGDRPYSSVCDYMKSCQYVCRPTKNLTQEDIKDDSYNETFIMINTDKIIQRIKMLFKERFFYAKTELIKHINVLKQYPLIQINAALHQLIEDKNEFVSDKYGRLGNVINIGELYLYQPLELKQKHISRDQRSIPIPYKRETLQFEEPKIVKEISKLPPSEQLSTDTVEMLQRIQEKYDTASTKQIIIRGENNIYKFWSDSIRLLEATGVSKEVLVELLVAHIVQNLLLEETILLLNYLESSGTRDYNLTPELEEHIKIYFRTQYMEGDKLTGILLPSASDKTGRILLIRDTQKEKIEWVPAQFQDQQDLLGEIKSLIAKLQKYRKRLNNHIGFIINFKGIYMVFKVKDLAKKRNKGARCDQSTRNVAVRVLEYIYPEIFDLKKMKSTQLCVLQELYLRLFSKEQKNNKVWFLSPIESQILDIENL